MADVWKISVQSLSHANSCHPVNLHAFVLTQNHYHLLIDTPNEDIDLFMYEFNKKFSLLLRKKTQLINRMFGGRYKWSIVKNEKSYRYVLRYIFQNPVRAKVCDSILEYPYSTTGPDVDVSKLEFRPYIDILSKKKIWNNLNSSIQKSKRELFNGHCIGVSLRLMIKINLNY